MSTSVIVLSHRPGDWLVRCLQSVVTQADEVVLVDNDSPDGEAARVGTGVGVTVVRSSTNSGFAGGVNLGLRHARGDVIALLNDDAIAEPGWLQAATEVLEDPLVAAVTPKVRLSGWWREVVFDDRNWQSPGDERVLGRQVRSVTLDGEDVLPRVAGVGIHRLETDPGDPTLRWRWTAGSQPWYVPVGDPADAGTVLIDGAPPPAGPVCRLINNAGSFLRPDGYIGDYGLEAPDDGRFDRTAERFSASGTALVTRAATFATLGGMATPYFAYYEDSDWSWRARLAGMRTVYDPRTAVEHRRSATSGGITDPWVQRLGERNRLLTAVRNAPARVATNLVVRRLREGPDQGIRRAMLTRLPWAAATRVQLSRRWATTPETVWARWAGADIHWDAGPFRER